jgi:hypothetical protein
MTALNSPHLIYNSETLLRTRVDFTLRMYTTMPNVVDTTLQVARRVHGMADASQVGQHAVRTAMRILSTINLINSAMS